MERYISNISTLIGAQRLTVEEGKGKGTSLLRVYNGKIQLLLNIDRGLDIYQLDYMGAPYGFISKNGLVNPKLYSPGIGFLQMFAGGFMYTCGLDNIGVPGEDTVQHGSNGYLPAEDVTHRVYCEDGRYFVEVVGTVRSTALFGRNLALKRTVRLEYMSDTLSVEDVITNEAYTDGRYMAMYHCNLGYPMLDQSAVIKCGQIKATESATEIAEGNRHKMLEIEEPTPGRFEDVYCHEIDKNKTEILVDSDFGSVKFEVEGFPYLVEWKTMACGDYALGIEPATTGLNKQYTPIKPGESHTYKLSFTFARK